MVVLNRSTSRRLRLCGIHGQWRVRLRACCGTLLGLSVLDMAGMVIEEVVQGQETHHHAEVDGFAHAGRVDWELRRTSHGGCEL